MESLQSNPILEGKGANTFAISLWLAHCTAELALRMPAEHNRLLATALWGFTRTVTICKAHFWLDDAAVAELHITRPVALCAFKALCAESLARNRNYYPLKPKCHMFDHTIRDACRTRLSPTAHWCFSDEDFIGRMKLLSAKCHLYTLALKSMRKWCLRLYLTLQRQDD